MRNVCLLIPNVYFFCIVKNSVGMILNGKVEEMNSRQSRTFGPLLGILISTFIEKSTGKYYPEGSFQISYDHKPWFAYNKPSYNYYDSSYYKPTHSHWYPLSDPQNYVTTDFNPILSYEQLVNIHSDLITNIETPPEFGGELASSNTKYRRQNVNAPRRQTKPKITTKRKKNQERRRYTTSVYENITERNNKLKRKTKPTTKRKRITTTTPHEDSYEDSFEKTTKYRRRRPVKNKHKYKNRQSEYDENYSTQDPDDYNNRYEYVTSEEYSTENDDYLARQEEEFTTSTTVTSTTTTTNPSTTTEMTTSTESTTTTEVTTTQNTTMEINLGYGPPKGNDNITITYNPPENNITTPIFTGYGPSNGNENISITYGPPIEPKIDYPSPYIDWYSYFSSMSDIVKKVNDIVNFDSEQN